MWFIFNDGYIRTNRSNGVWFISSDKEPRLGFPINLYDSTCTAPKQRPCEYYMKFAASNQRIYTVSGWYNANMYDWIFPDFNNHIGYRYYIVPHYGTVNSYVYGTTLSGKSYIMISYELLYTNVEMPN